MNRKYKDELIRNLDAISNNNYGKKSTQAPNNSNPVFDVGHYWLS